MDQTRYVCSARGCKFSGTYQEGVKHINEELRKREAETAAQQTPIEEVGLTTVPPLGTLEGRQDAA